MFNINDKAMLSGLKHLLDNATFPLKKREVATFIDILKWINELEVKIQNDLISKPEKKKKKGLSK